MSLQAIINHTDEIQKEINLSGYQSEYFCNRMLVESILLFLKWLYVILCRVVSYLHKKHRTFQTVQSVHVNNASWLFNKNQLINI
jgi:hypothetical protein